MQKKKNILIVTRDFSKEVSTRFERIIMIPVKGMAENLRGLSVDQILAPKKMNTNEQEWFNESIFPLAINGHSKNMKITYY
ncbi:MULTISPECIES: hypothetical protein [Bacillus]|uniref:Uncharacterized protein n=1 Tax=Bacillus thuringiensis TaxID=1428 RepID=A0A9X7GFS6_BACTU|nr:MULTISPECIES: hypothetical protein [Bacillus cereus group]MBJ7935630.1 hypothetical protein [Bacillus cereus]MCU5224143.1 hypothetical protein [Bacillus tropicus]PES55952.1 hypothetical protein CN499_05885 [Bacillus thuringiensis]PFV35657.1 hypothetical protein COK99_01160 [Bacillus thuringiensis]PGV22927.1 hypothetical protein COD93_29110 [Bacillus cereus]